MNLPRRRMLGLSALGVGGAVAGCSAPTRTVPSSPATRDTDTPTAEGPPGRAEPTRPAKRPNIVLILADDMGFSDIGCYGSEISTPHLDRLAAGGVRMSQFYNTARCSPSRASLLTGLHPHQTGVGVLNKPGQDGYRGTLNRKCLTLAELLGDAGYATAMYGKWHLTADVAEPDVSWPLGRGFDHHYGIIEGSSGYFTPNRLYNDNQHVPRPETGSYYLTTELGRRAANYVTRQTRIEPDRPFFLYLPFTAPHWPLHAPADAVKRQSGRYRAGWDKLRERRFDRLVSGGILSGRWQLSERDASVPAWGQKTKHPQWQQRRMEVYAAQVELMDAAIGKVVAALRRSGQLDQTLIIFLSDNGGCAEELHPRTPQADEHRAGTVHTGSRKHPAVRRGNIPSIMPGPDSTFSSYGRPWANVSNTPFREYKHWVHEGGISTPLIAHWPDRLPAGQISHHPHQLTDVMATVLDITGLNYPRKRAGHRLLAIEGYSMMNSWLDRPEADSGRYLYWEHEGNCAVRQGRWKLVRKFGKPWELYDLSADRTELHDLAHTHQQLVQDLDTAYRAWAKRCNVHPWVPRKRTPSNGTAVRGRKTDDRAENGSAARNGRS